MLHETFCCRLVVMTMSFAATCPAVYGASENAADLTSRDHQKYRGGQRESGETYLAVLQLWTPFSELCTSTRLQRRSSAKRLRARCHVRNGETLHRSSPAFRTCRDIRSRDFSAPSKHIKLTSLQFVGPLYSFKLTVFHFQVLCFPVLHFQLFRAIG